MSSAGAQRLQGASSRGGGRQPRRIRVYDCRSGDKPSSSGPLLETSGLDFNHFLQILHEKFAIHSHETFVLVTTDRKPLDLDRFAELQNGSTLYLLRRKDQALQLAMEEHITFTPHYDTLIRSGLHEYYASEGQKPLPYALAELIDNALWATAKNTGTRTIELRMLFDESLGKPAIVVLDNGCGMTLKQLNNWAVFRHSKFTRKDGYVRPDPVPRSLNSDISYFGVGGKQAVFYIGDSTRMISKPVGSPDVHELVLSKEDFERKERNKEDIYSGVIRNRKPGDSSHVNKDNERFLHALIAEESGKESFTAVVITGIGPQHITFLKQDFEMWTRELAHTYHYYIHGLNGNDMKSSFSNSDQLPKIDIQVTLLEKHPRSPRVMNLREVDNDMQTLYINAAADKFEFKATTGLDTGTVEGVIRYHPFLYDKETYPEDPYAVQEPCNEDDDSDESGIRHQARGKRPIFECFWNGRLIPYTTVSEFDWCAWPGTTSKIPEECYSRFSGVLFTDDKFQVSTNKLTFMDLEQRVRSKETIFTRVVNGKEQRITHKNMFFSWLKNCHEKLDKQVKFLGFKEIVKRDDVTSKKMQHPWATFSSIEWDGNIYKTGQLVKSQKTIPILHGTVVQFLLYGDHDKDVFATGGQVEVCLVRKEFGSFLRLIALNQLPHKLKVDWPDGNPWPENGVRPAGTPLGKMLTCLHINQFITSLHQISLNVVKSNGLSYVGLGNDEEVVSFVAQHTTKWHFFFRKMVFSANILTKISQATNSSSPSQVRITVAEGFEMDGVSSTLHVGVPFDIPLHLKDCYGNAILSVPTVKSQLVLYTKLQKKISLVILSSVLYFVLQTYDLKVTLPGLKKDTQTFKVSVLPGNPHSIHVMTEENPITVENGTPVRLNVEIHDEVGNVTAHPRQIVHCQVQGLPPVKIDCSSTGAGQLVTKPINLNIIGGEPQKLKVQFVSKKKAFLLRNNEKIEWLAGGTLGKLFYKLYDEAGRAVPLTDEIASMIKVNWTSPVNLKDLLQGKLPDIQVPTQVLEDRFYQVSYQDQSVSVSFTINNRSVEVTGIRFLRGSPGIRELLFTCFSYMTAVIVKVTAGHPAQLKLVSGPKQVRKVLFHCCSTRGYYQLNFNGSFNNKPIPGPSVSLAVLPDPNKPVSLSVEYDSAARFPAGGTCPGFCSERAGKYTIQFSLHIDETRSLLSNQITINVVANQPVKLGPDSQPPAPVVSCCMDIAHRTLVKNMTLTIMDSYGNPAGQDLGGKVVASIRSSSGDSNKPIPLFDGNIKRYPINLVQGKAHIASLSIKENSPGEDGSAYTLLFDAEVPMVPTPLAPFELTFHFYNEADRILRDPRRVCSIRDNFRGQQDVLGMVGHLAYVQDDAAARVISWHIRGDMDCVITRTTEAARRIYDNTQGRQQVMALDSMYVPPLNRGLPHMRNGCMLFEPPGNPVLARELLMSPQEGESCDIVFQNILKETILIDDLDSANNYRREVVQNKMPCPTILTRNGERVSAIGKFGGAQNKAPPIDTLTVFGAPLPQHYHSLIAQAELLCQCRTAVEKRDRAQKDRDDHLLTMNSLQTREKQQDMEKKEKRLEEIERQLSMFVESGRKGRD
uniref:Structural maintenance of chromosomes flexible hinge domain containing 1 n=1 Tax=Scophthalmus maximus TaxID=52904 RepID=A0A8D3CS64_SCOMX